MDKDISQLTSRTKINLKSLASFSTLIFVLLIYHLSTVQTKDIASDPGTGWHLKTGEYVINNFSIPKFDPFLSEAKYWVSDQWLGDVVFWIFFQLGSWPLLYGLVTAIFITTFFIVGAKIAQNSLKKVLTGSKLLALFPLILAFKITEIHYLVRPVVFSFLIFSFLLYTLQKLLESLEDEPNLSINSFIKKFWYLPLVFILWANFHPSFSLGLIVLAITCLSSILNFYTETDKLVIKKIILLTFICSLATLVNPYFIFLHLSIIDLGSNKFFMNFHQEWLPPKLRSTEGMFTELMLGIIFINLLLKSRFNSLKTNFRTCTWAILITSFIHFGMSSVRMLPYLSLILIAPTTVALAELYIRFKSKFVIRKLNKIPEWDFKAPNSVLLKASCIFFILCPLLGFSPFPESTLAPRKDKFPYESVNFLNSLKTDETTNVFALPKWGGFISLYLKENYKGVIDDRNTLVGEKKYKRMLKAKKSIIELNRFMTKENTRYAILPRGLINRLDPFTNSVKLKVIFTGKVAEVVEKKLATE